MSYKNLNIKKCWYRSVYETVQGARDLFRTGFQPVSTVALAAAVLTIMASDARAQPSNNPAALSNGYLYTFTDFITGNNGLVEDDGQNGFEGTISGTQGWHWYPDGTGSTNGEGVASTASFDISADADAWFRDEFERPFPQTKGTSNLIAADFSGNGWATVSGDFFANLDVVDAGFDLDSTYAYFYIDLFDDGFYKSDGRSFDQEGLKQRYGVRSSTADVNGQGGQHFWISDPSGQSSSWTLDGEAFQDTDVDLIQPGVGAGTGYEEQIIGGGKLKGTRNGVSNDTEVMWTRIRNDSFTISTADTPTGNARGHDGPNPNGGDVTAVEFAIRYDAMGWTEAELLTGDSFMKFLGFEATKGTQNDSDYVFNREWNVFQAGTPYNDGITQDQNIYELDTMTGFGNANSPEPSSALLAVIGFVTLLSTGRRSFRPHPHQARFPACR